MTTIAPSRVDLQRFEEEGYLLIEDVFDPVRDLDPVVAEYTEKLDRIAAEWKAAGKIQSTYSDLPFTERFAHILNDTGSPGYKPFDICLSGKITDDEPMEQSMHVGPAVFDLITHPRLLDVVEQLIGPEILSNPIQHVRIKPPEALLKEELYKRNTMMARVEWHQDQGVALPEVDETDMLTVWFPVLDATVENGCLCVVPGSHQRGLLLHCPSKPGQAFDLRIPEEVRGAGGFPVPMKRGSAIFLHRRTMHSSLSNKSQGVRWSFDLRYQPIGQPTGRPWFPAFVARSQQDPSSEIHDWRAWAKLWEDTRTRLAHEPGAMRPRRWTGTEPQCA
ncbi:MAG TPA: phytanoyl-CoA dioxygenase family protein [Chloroflexota bacterium]|nr:phytanoyl-CoA dioxygenase family protein [Chloroflexota bacterium]